MSNDMAPAGLGLLGLARGDRPALSRVLRNVSCVGRQAQNTPAFTAVLSAKSSRAEPLVFVLGPELGQLTRSRAS